MAYIGRSGWNTLRLDGAIPDEELRDAVDASYELVVAKLPKKRRPLTPRDAWTAIRRRYRRCDTMAATEGSIPARGCLVITASPFGGRLPGRRSARNSFRRAGETSGYLLMHRDRKALNTVDVSATTWWVTIGAMVVFLVIDVGIIARRPHVPSMRECAIALSFYVGAAVVFGIWIWSHSGSQYAGEFFAGWLTEYSLSVDNLFVFLLIMRKFLVPEKLQQEALVIGIVIAIILRGIFIALGAAVINEFASVFYIFGLFLIYTAVKLAREGSIEDDEFKENRFLKWVERRFPVTPEFHGPKIVTRIDGKKMLTPMFIVIVALGTTDLLFALDSIPAIYGLTKEPYLVLTANIFALMGLRQLYFLIGGLLERLVYLEHRARRAARVHRREADPARHAREQPAVHQRRRADPGPRGPDRGVAGRHRAHPRRDHGRQPGEERPRPLQASARPAPEAAPAAPRAVRSTAGCSAAGSAVTSGSRSAWPRRVVPMTRALAADHQRDARAAGARSAVGAARGTRPARPAPAPG